MSIKIQEIHDREQWNAFLLRQPHGHFLQSYEWGELNREQGDQIYRLGVVDDERLIGALSLTVAAVPLPLPKLLPTWLYSARGPVLEHLDVSVLTQLLQQVEGVAQQERAVVLRVEPNVADDDPNLDTWLAVYHKAGFQSNPNSVHGRRSWVLDLQPDRDALLHAFTPACRQRIYQAERQGVTIREACGEQDFHRYYELLKSSAELNDVFVHSKDYHRNLLQAFSRQHGATILLALQDGKAVAAKLLLRFGNWCWDMFNGHVGEDWLQPATYLLQYHALQWAQEQGCRFFDFRSIPDVLVPGEDLWDVYEYKKSFGGFSRLTMPTQDYIYQPLIYKPWRKLVEIGKQQRHKERQYVDGERQVLASIPEAVSDAD
ncbi:lipid II:glycine glycyltransferase FemX [Dictyobacter arantiisoli]|uniref:Methicillin resistance protein n=1 Tax=Dictyobacter arantiisoli TaxID=2014874 RepID=A0A5A5T711_9CHLR|nr:peptidoglycan bridge formation glycyltransferase FemA/FemB family protein [Dictyobacter arantiisoli]GCF07187.1 methicillin resistance protein [Dictyobacter arantiisoli]